MNGWGKLFRKLKVKREQESRRIWLFTREGEGDCHKTKEHALKGRPKYSAESGKKFYAELLLYNTQVLTLPRMSHLAFRLQPIISCWDLESLVIQLIMAYSQVLWTTTESNLFRSLNSHKTYPFKTFKILCSLRKS